MTKEEIIARLETFRKLEPGWDSYRAQPPNVAAIDNAIAFTSDLFIYVAAFDAKVEISPFIDGGVLVDIEAANWHISFTFYNSGKTTLFGEANMT
jgi:hypothetical protein